MARSSSSSIDSDTSLSERKGDELKVVKGKYAKGEYTVYFDKANKKKNKNKKYESYWVIVEEKIEDEEGPPTFELKATYIRRSSCADPGEMEVEATTLFGKAMQQDPDVNATFNKLAIMLAECQIHSQEDMKHVAKELEKKTQKAYKGIVKNRKHRFRRID